MNQQLYGMQSKAGSHPLQSLFILLGLVFLGALVGTVISLIVAIMVTGITDLNTILASLTGGSASDLTVFRILQGGGSLGMFALPPFFLGLIEGDKFAYMRSDRSASITLFLIVLVMTYAGGGVSAALGEWNAAMKLPPYFADLEHWMAQKEKEMAEVTVNLLKDISLGGLIGNLIVVAVIAAIGEELLFRGALQPILVKLFGNVHWGIWLTAIVFSAIHMQFYGFLPRLFLGVLFGYLYVWSKNIWIPIFAHFVNNAASLLTAYVYQKQGNTLTGMDLGYDVPVYVYFISFAVFGVTLWYFRQRVKIEHVGQDTTKQSYGEGKLG